MFAVKVQSRSKPSLPSTQAGGVLRALTAMAGSSRYLGAATTKIGVDTAYSTASVRVPDRYDGEPLVFITGPASHFTRRGYVIRIENGALLVSLIGHFGNYPPTDRRDYSGSPKSCTVSSPGES